MSRSANPTVRLSATSSMIITGSKEPEEVKSRKRLENTYRMEPKTHFPGDSTKAIIKEVLETSLNGQTYNQEECNKMSADLANKIKTRVRATMPQRYKVVTFVTVGEEKLATVSLGSRCLWNAKYDTYSEYSYHNGSIYAVGMVYGVFAE